MPRKGLLDVAIEKALADRPPALTREDVETIVRELLGLGTKKRMGRPPKNAV